MSEEHFDSERQYSRSVDVSLFCTLIAFDSSSFESVLYEFFS
jgi:hypothetical protein